VKSSIRIMFLGLAAAGALAFAGIAAARSHPVLIVSNLDPLFATQELIVAGPTTDPPIAETTMYVGPGNGMTLRPTRPFGEVDADLMSNADYGNSIFQLYGDVVSVNPSAYKNNTCAPGLHSAVWIARLQPLFLDVTFKMPIYVDYAEGAQKSYASYVLKTCMPSPYDPYPGGAIFGGRFLDFQLYLGNFTRAVSNRWTTVVTPFDANGGLDSRGAAEAQSIVQQGSISTLDVKRTVKRHGKKHKKRYYTTITGQVTLENGTGVPASLQVYELFGKEGGPEIAELKADESGNFSLKVRQKHTASFAVVANQYGTFVRPPVCNPVLDIGFGPLACSSVATSDLVAARISKTVHIPNGGAGISPARARTIVNRRFLPAVRGRLTP
jgi:hypothetical protein